MLTRCLACLGQQCAQLQDALLFNPDSFFIILLDISPHCLKRPRQVSNTGWLAPLLCPR